MRRLGRSQRSLVQVTEPKDTASPQQRSGTEVTLDALADLDRQRQAHARRANEINRDPMAETVERYSLLSAESIELETRAVRFDMTFNEPASIRGQAELIIGIMQDIVATLSDARTGSVKQRLRSRQVADAGRRHLVRYNGKTPRGDTKRRIASSAL